MYLVGIPILNWTIEMKVKGNWHANQMRRKWKPNEKGNHMTGTWNENKKEMKTKWEGNTHEMKEMKSSIFKELNRDRHANLAACNSSTAESFLKIKKHLPRLHKNAQSCKEAINTTMLNVRSMWSTQCEITIWTDMVNPTMICIDKPWLFLSYPVSCSHELETYFSGCVTLPSRMPFTWFPMRCIGSRLGPLKLVSWRCKMGLSLGPIGELATIKLRSTRWSVGCVGLLPVIPRHLLYMKEAHPSHLNVYRNQYNIQLHLTYQIIRLQFQIQSGTLRFHKWWSSHPWNFTQHTTLIQVELLVTISFSPWCRNGQKRPLPYQ